MALMKCKECGREVSDRAKECPGCGCPVSVIIQQNNEELVESNKKIKREDVNQTEMKDVKAKKDNKKRIIIVVGILATIVFVILLVKVVGKDVSVKEPVQLNVSEVEEDKQETKQFGVKMAWKDGDAPTEVGDTESVAKILDSKIIDSSYGALLVMEFEYSNNSENAKNFINDSNCQIRPYQNGVELENPGVTSESEKYDYSDAFTSIKKGGIIKTQLVWVLKDTVNPIEVDFGLNEKYQPDYSKNNKIIGGEIKGTDTVSENIVAKSDYVITWGNEPPEIIGDDNEQAIIKNIAIIDSVEYGMVLVMDIDFINNLKETRNLINDLKCRIVPYQNGIELETPGVTSSEGEFNYWASFTSVKNGGKVSTQLAWVLRDDNPIEVEFGLDEKYQPKYTEILTFEK